MSVATATLYLLTIVFAALSWRGYRRSSREAAQGEHGTSRMSAVMATVSAGFAATCVVLLLVTA